MPIISRCYPTEIMAEHNDIGRWGENIAREYLAAKGYAIVESNVRMGKKELDIVAMHGSRIVFVEVKTRTNPDFDPLEAMDARKIRNLSYAADAYVRSRRIPHEVQFDIIVIAGVPHGEYRVEHYPDAFLAPLSTTR